MTSPTGPAGVLATVVDALDHARIPHMLVGSSASTVHGADRSTQDIDILIDPTPETLQSLTDQLASTDMYVITNSLPDGPATVEILESDAAFESSSCGTWERVE